MDYAHAVTRLQELYQRTEESGVSDDEAVELEHLGRSVPKLIAMLPDVLRDRSDARHNAAVTEMTTQLTKHLDRVKPLAIVRVLLMVEHIAEKLIWSACSIIDVASVVHAPVPTERRRASTQYTGHRL